MHERETIEAWESRSKCVQRVSPAVFDTARFPDLNENYTLYVEYRVVLPFIKAFQCH